MSAALQSHGRDLTCGSAARKLSTHAASDCISLGVGGTLKRPVSWAMRAGVMPRSAGQPPARTRRKGGRPLRFGDTEVAADFAGEKLVDFSMTRNG
jgi:hypothetical protein